MPIQKIVSSEKNNITLNNFIGEKDRLFFDVTTRTFRLSDGVTPGGIVVNTGGGGGGSYADFNVDLHLNRSTANSGEVLSWSGTDYAWISPGIQTSDLSLTTNSASGNGNLTYNNATGAFVFTPPDISSKIALTDLSVTVASPNISNLSYDDTTGAFTFTPPDLSGYATTASLSAYATTASVASKIELTDLSVGAEAPASGNGAISYDNTQGKFTYTPPVIPATLLNLGISDGTTGQLLQTDGSGNFSFVSISTGGLGNIVEDTTPQLGGTLDANGNSIDMDGNELILDVDGDTTVKSPGGSDDDEIHFKIGGTDRVQFDTVFIRPMTDLGYSLGSNNRRFNNLNTHFAFISYKLELLNNAPIVFEGATDDAFETTLNVIDPTADRTINLPDANGTVLLDGTVNTSIDTHLNQSNPTSGYVLSWNGSDYAWVAQTGGGTPGGSTTQVQFNDAGAFGGDSDFTYNSTTNTLTVPNITATNLTVTGAGSTTITAGANIELDATNRVLVTDTPFRVASLTTTQRNAIASPANGDIIYNSTTNQIESYENSAWGAIAGGSSGGIALTDLSVGTPNPASGAGAISYDDSTGVFKYTPPDTSSFLTSVAFSDLTSTPTTLAGYGITDGYTNSDVDAHLNQTNPTSGYVLSWNGSDYAWVAQAGGGTQNVFDKIAVSGQNNVEADSTTDTLTFVAGSNMTITTDASTDTITFASTGGGGTTTNPEFTESVTIQSDQGTSPAESESVIFYGDTTTNAPTRLYRNSSNASISVPAQTTVFFEADIVGRHNSSTDFGSFKIKGVIDRDGSNNTQLIMSQKEVLYAGANNLFDANIVADNTNELLAVEVTGESTKTIRWSALVKTTSSFQNATLENAPGSAVPTQFALPQTNYIVSTPPTGNSSIEGRNMVFNPAGTILHVGGNSDDISYYDLSTPWDISTATIDQNKSFRVTGTPWTDNVKWASNSFTFNADGSKVITAAYSSPAGNIGIHEYTMSTNYEIASVGTTPSASASVTVATLNTPWNALKSTGWSTNFYSGGRDLKVKLVDSGTKIVFFTGYSSSYLDMQIHPLTVAYDISTIDYSTASVIGCYDFEYELINNIVPGRYSSFVIHGDDFQFSSDGTVLWMSVYHRMGSNPPGYTYEVDLFKFNLSTPWNVTASSLSYDGYRALGENAVGSDYKLTERLRSFHIEESQNKIFMHLQELFNNQGTNIQSSYSLAEFSYS